MEGTNKIHWRVHSRCLYNSWHVLSVIHIVSLQYGVVLNWWLKFWYCNSICQIPVRKTVRHWLFGAFNIRKWQQFVDLFDEWLNGSEHVWQGMLSYKIGHFQHVQWRMLLKYLIQLFSIHFIFEIKSTCLYPNMISAIFVICNFIVA